MQMRDFDHDSDLGSLKNWDIMFSLSNSKASKVKKNINYYQKIERICRLDINHSWAGCSDKTNYSTHRSHVEISKAIHSSTGTFLIFFPVDRWYP